MADIIQKHILVDHHAHVMRADFLQLDAIGLRQAFTESRSASQIEQHVPNSLSYRDCLRKLGALFDLPGTEESILRFRMTMKEADYINLLFDDVSIGGMIVDDGFLPSSAMTLPRFANLIERPLFVCRRIENVIEEALLSADSFETLESSFANYLLRESYGEIVAFKTIAAYRGGLELTVVSQEDAKTDFQRAKDSLIGLTGKPRITRGALYHYLLMRSFVIASQRNLPVQLHCGIGDQDEDLRQANPLALRDLFESAKANKTRFVLLHCYPFMREASYLCSIYGNVYMDLSLTSFLATGNLDEALIEAMTLAPISKILAGTDGHSVPETYWYAARSIKSALKRVLDTLSGRDLIDPKTTNETAAAILHENARSLYSLEGLR